jgi:hypothetical protein
VKPPVRSDAWNNAATTVTAWQRRRGYAVAQPISFRQTEPATKDSGRCAASFAINSARLEVALF